MPDWAELYRWNKNPLSPDYFPLAPGLARGSHRGRYCQVMAHCHHIRCGTMLDG
ncbi:hypothetical protein J6590_059618 [Homalodisca vitripennis]|nr:hypothetical protein J6590_059618 [Homalodisca vitripennis]